MQRLCFRTAMIIEPLLQINFCHPEEERERDREKAEATEPLRDEDWAAFDARVLQVDDESLRMYVPWLQEVLNRKPQLDPGNCSLEQLFAAQAAHHQRRTFSRIPAQAGDAFLAAVRPALQVMVGALVAKNDDL